MTEYTEAVLALQNVVAHKKHLDDSFDAGTSPLAQQICYGVIRQFYSLDYILSQLLKKPLPAKHLDLKLLLMAGIYSVKALKRPDYASVNAAVEAASSLNKQWAKGLVNGVLRQYLREQQNLDESAHSSEEARLEHPRWLIDMISQAWPDRPGIFTSNNTQAPLTLRVNLLRTTRDEYLVSLTALGLSARKGELSNASIILTEAVPVTGLPGFADGVVSIQDEAPQLAAGLLHLEKGFRVLDACAAPGGKTCHLLETEPGIEVTAIDRDARRMKLTEENLARLGLGCEVLTVSLEDYRPNKRFDRILLDAPCSATGIIRRHPDIKLLRKKSDIDKLSSIQRVLLTKAFDLLKHGGELLYSTCSVLPEENDHVITRFLASMPDAALLPIDFNNEGIEAQDTETGLQLFPTTDSHDGFFYARIGKRLVNSQ